MKKIILNILIVSAIFALIFFLIKISSKNILGDLLDTNKVQKENIVQQKNDKLLNKKVPFFDLPSLDDNRIKLSQFTNKPLVIVFFASSNIESSNQLKIIDEYVSKESKIDKLVSVIAIDNQEESSIIKSFMRRGGYEVLTAMDVKGDIGEAFSIKSLPTTFFIDRDGLVREIYSGVLNESMLVDKIEQLLN